MQLLRKAKLVMLIINRNVELKSSIEWIKLSFNTFREKPLQFITLGLFSTLLGLMPLFGAFMTPLFIAKFARLTAKVENNEPVLFSSLFEDLFANKLVVRLAFVSFCFNAIIFISQYLIDNILKQRGVDISNPSSGVMLIFFIPSMILQIAMWLSPLICLYNTDITPLQAMWLSIKACGTNIATLLIYSLMVLFFTLLAILPLGLGLLIWLPMLNIVAYFIYKSMFVLKVL